MKAGYYVVDFSDVEVTLASATGNVTVTVDPEIVNKLKDLHKPAMVQNLTITAEGATIHAAGFTHHVLAAGVHTHTIQGIAMAPVGDNSIQFTVTA